MITKPEPAKKLMTIEGGATHAEIIEEICEEIEAGALLSDICNDSSRVSMRHFHRLVGRDSASWVRYSRARTIQMHVWADDIIKISDDTTADWKVERRQGEDIEVFDAIHVRRSQLMVDTRKFLMAKIAGKFYGDKVQIDHSIEDKSESMGKSELARRVAMMIASGGDDVLGVTTIEGEAERLPDLGSDL